MSTENELNIKITGKTADYEQAVARVQGTTDRFFKKVAEGAPATERSLRPLVAQQIALRKEIEQTYGSVSKATPEVRAHYDEMTQRVTQAKRVVAELNNELADQRAEVNLAGASWRGWGQGLEQLAGKHGATVAKIGLGSIVLREVINVTKDFLRVTDSGELEIYASWWDSATGKIIDHKKSLVDATLAAVMFGKAISFGDFGGARRGQDIYSMSWSDIMNPVGYSGGARKANDAAVIGPARPTFGQLLQSSSLTDARLREEQRRADELSKREAERAAKVAEAYGRRTEALAFEVAILKESSAFRRAEIQYSRDMAAAAREETAQLRALAEQKAAILYQNSQNAAFTGLVKGGRRLSDLGASHGVQGRGWAPDAEWNVMLGELRDSYEQAQLDDAIRKWESAFGRLSRNMGDVIIDAAFTGGENFGRIAGYRVAELMEQGVGNAVAWMTTPKQGKDGKWYLPGSQQGYSSPADATAAGEGRAKNMQGAFDFAAIGMNAYGASAAAPGQRTGGVISGAVSGAPVSGVWGAATRAIIGAIGGALGAQQRQDAYKYGVPFVSQTGGAWGHGWKNVEPAEQAALIAQVQDRFDSVWNAYVRILLKAPESIIPELQAIDGRFQKEGSQYFLKHFNEWLNGTLPDEVAKQFQGSLGTIFQSVGVEAEKFAEIWARFDKLDPSKVPALWLSLYEALESLSDSRSFLGASNQWGGNTSFIQGITGERKLMDRTMAQVMTQDHFSPILDLARGLNSLVGEDQIRALREIADLQKAAADSQKQAMREIIRIADDAKEKRIAAVDRYTMGMMRDEEGAPDYDRQARFLESKAEAELRAMNNAKTPEEAARRYDRYLALVDQIIGLGYQQNYQTGDKWAEWGIEQVTRAETVLANRLDKLGAQVSEANARFLAEFQPILDTFLEVGSGLGAVGDGLGGVGREAEILIPLMGSLGDEVNTTVSLFAQLNSSLRDSAFLTSTINQRSH
jgi:hypothetical protein